MNFTPGEKVIVALQIGATNRKSGRHVFKAPFEKEGEFLQLTNKGKNALVRLHTAEGLVERSYPLKSVRKP